MQISCLLVNAQCMHERIKCDTSKLSFIDRIRRSFEVTEYAPQPADIIDFSTGKWLNYLNWAWSVTMWSEQWLQFVGWEKSLSLCFWRWYFHRCRYHRHCKIRFGIIVWKKKVFQPIELAAWHEPLSCSYCFCLSFRHQMYSFCLLLSPWTAKRDENNDDGLQFISFAQTTLCALLSFLSFFTNFLFQLNAFRNAAIVYCLSFILWIMNIRSTSITYWNEFKYNSEAHEIALIFYLNFRIR